MILFASCDRLPENRTPAVVPDVLVLTVQPETVRIQDEFLGKLDGSTNIEIRARIQGYLTQVHVREGEVVNKGELLFQIDLRPLEAAVEQARSELARAEAAAGRSKLELERQQKMLAEKATSQRDYDNAQQANLANLASVAAAKAALQQAELNLEYGTMNAPVTGIVGKTHYGVGDIVGQKNLGEELTTVSVVDPIKVIVPLPESDYLRFAEALNKAMALSFEQRPENMDLILSDGSIHPHKGRFFSASREVDPKTGTFNLTCAFPNPGNVLRPGQFARVRSTIQTLTDALVIPQRAVIETQGVRQVAVVQPDDIVALRRVKTGAQIGSGWVVEAGLAAGERVVVEGLQKVAAGQKVAPKPYSPPASPAAMSSASANPPQA